jgi:D-aminoacyl-tRNA deacylase
MLVTIRELHLHVDDVDLKAMSATGYPVEEVIFLSRHRAASGIPTLTVHPIGNHGSADFGGRPETLVPASPRTMTAMLRKLAAERGDLPFEVSFEVTHHGPYLGCPTAFIEIGSSEEWWGHDGAAWAVARTVLGAEGQEHPVAIGVGGGHYAPRFTEISLTHRISFGHMVPNYALKGKGDDELEAILRRAMDASGATLAYVHRKSMKRSEATRVVGILEAIGLKVVSSKDLVPL